MSEGCEGGKKWQRREVKNYGEMKVFHSPQCEIILRITWIISTCSFFFFYFPNGSQKEEWIFFLLFIIFFYTHSPAGAGWKESNHKGWNYYVVYIWMQQQNVFEAEQHTKKVWRRNMIFPCWCMEISVTSNWFYVLFASNIKAWTMTVSKVLGTF